MADLLPERSRGAVGARPNTEHLDPFLEQRLEARPWELRSAQWRAWALAEAVFGKGVEVRLSGQGNIQGLRGLLTLVVPFSTLGEHRTREGIFLSWAQADPVLAQVSLLYVFEPATAPVP